MASLLSPFITITKRNKMTDLNTTISLLDHGHIRLVDFMGSDLSVVRSARVSYDAEWRAGEDEGKDAKLIGYLMKNKHTSPFESVAFTFDVKLPIFVTRQWHRHRTWKYNEISGRYAELPEEFYIPEVGKYGTQSTSNKQMRDTAAAAFGVSAEEAEKEMKWQAEQQEVMEYCFKVYHKHIAEGMPRELARIVLPLATYTHMFASVDLHNLFHYLRLRMHSHSQYEIRVYALAILELIRPIVPECVKAFEASLVI
jgi:thymidylate synthase (FAD)